MALLQNVLTTLRGKKNVEPKIATAVSDDGTGAAIAAGELSPLRADPTTGALITTSTGTGGAALATQTTLAAIEKNARTADSITFTEHTVTNASLALPVLATPYGFELQVPSAAGGKVWVRPIGTVTTSGAGRGWEIAVGSSRYFHAPTTTGWVAISTAATVEILIAHEVKA
jgi:hypothetical protein